MTEAKNRRGPRGGPTVSKNGLVRKTLWHNETENEPLRRQAGDDRWSESDIVRELLLQRYDLAAVNQAEMDGST